MARLNLTAPINQLGAGVVGLNATLALQRLGVELALWPQGQVQCPAEHAPSIRRAIELAKRYDQHAPSLVIGPPDKSSHHVGRGLQAALTYIEQTHLPPHEEHALSTQDVVIASSKWMHGILTDRLPGQRIEIAQPGVDRTLFSPEQDQADSTNSHSGPTTFLAVGKWEVRKGHDVLPAVFEAAFNRTDPVKLILLTANPFLRPEQVAAWEQRFAPLGNQVEILRQRFQGQHSVAQLMKKADCGIFLSRGEGWNLDAAEMLAMGKHVVITNYSAHTEFATPQNAWLVETDSLEEARDGVFFHGPGRWASLGQRQIDQAVAHLRKIHGLKQTGKLTLNQAGIESMKQFSWEAFGEKVVRALNLAPKLSEA